MQYSMREIEEIQSSKWYYHSQFWLQQILLLIFLPPSLATGLNVSNEKYKATFWVLSSVPGKTEIKVMACKTDAQDNWYFNTLQDFNLEGTDTGDVLVEYDVWNYV